MADTFSDKGIIKKIIYSNKENGFSIIKLYSNKELFTAKGTFGPIFLEQPISFEATKIKDPVYGDQLEIVHYIPLLPDNVSHLILYLSAGNIKGIGPELTKKIVLHFDDYILTIFKNKEFDLLKEVHGIGRETIEKIKESWLFKEQFLSFLMDMNHYNISQNMALKLYNTYKEHIYTIIKTNPYKVIYDIDGISFITADELAQKMNLPDYQELKIIEGLLFLIYQHGQKGHIYISEDTLKTHALELLQIQDIEKHIKNLLGQERIKALKKDSIIYYALSKDVYCEQQISKLIVDHLKNTKPFKIDMDIVEDICKKYKLTSNQQEAILNTLTDGISILNGGPGTGKTTSLKALKEILDHLDLSILGGSPTGRAAQKIKEVSNINASTIHRILGKNKELDKKEVKKITCDILIIDESSMLDMYLFFDLLSLISEKTHILLVGDFNQLPSIGKGNILEDLINSNVIKCITLKSIFRQQEDSSIIKIAELINNQQLFKPSLYHDINKDFVFINSTKDDFFTNLSSLFKNNHVEKDAIILTCLNKGLLGNYAINTFMQDFLNNKEEEKLYNFKKKDKIIHIKNNYSLDVFNGDIGVIEDFMDDSIIVKYPDKKVTYQEEHVKELALAYSISIHKSQGSEFDTVIIPLFMNYYILLDKRLLYTAITRAKKKCIIIGEFKALACALKKDIDYKRTTFLSDRIKRDYEK